MRKTQSDGDLPGKLPEEGGQGPVSASSDVLGSASQDGVQLLKGGGSHRGSVLISLFERSPSQVGLGKVTKAHWKVSESERERERLRKEEEWAGVKFLKRKKG